MRLGWVRFQRCPVGKHSTILTPMKEGDLTDSERRIAAQLRHVRIA